MFYFILTITLFSLSGTSPVQFSWDNYNNTSYLGIISNQNFPNFCNSGWAFSAIQVLNSRIKIKRQAASPDIALSVQVLLSCDTLDYGCLGGEPMTAFKWIQKNNITDQSCHSYTAKGYTNGQVCNSIAKCQWCIDGKCKPASNSKIYAIHMYGSVSGQQDMMTQIQKFGPISCGISSTNLSNYVPNTILDVNGSKKIDHFVTVYGWGQNSQGQKYWLATNSYGPNWGNSGTFKIKKGQNTLGIQSRCNWASVRDTWTNDIRNKTLPGVSVIKDQQIDFPSPFNYSLSKFLTSSKSYLTPDYCKTNWAFTVIQMLADRQQKHTNGTKPMFLSVQALLNCGVGSCQKGGNPLDALVFIQKYGLPEQGCQTYQAKTPQRQSCNVINNCATCKGTIYKSQCDEVKDYKRWTIFDYGTLSGVQKMKDQVLWGPIVCGIHASKQFKNYKGGIFSQVSVSPKIDYYIQVVGWGEESGKKYWICRNMYGTSWGQSSFIRIQMGSNCLGIQTKCYWGNSLI